jgi:uncharacterized protein
MNRLIHEKSPYLLQHAHNPVNWYPWCEEAFETAKKEDKPVFLSIGYSTCHWCHVMEKESFEDAEVAKLMNDSFISIKVDREERPDIDGIYMNVCQILTGSGGWPMTIIMTPDKKPFFAGTYFPKQSRLGITGMMNLIPHLTKIWNERRNEIIKSSKEITEYLRSMAAYAVDEEVNEEIFNRAFNKLLQRFDETYGGFGNEPKFPTPHNFTFLLRYYKNYKSRQALKMVEKSLTEMRKGGIYDQLGFGISRYSTDREWRVPHFEKMLYDQAQLVTAYVETYLITKDNFYKNNAEEILDYVSREMYAQDTNGFFSAEDADSEGEEGKFYLWEVNEIKQLLNNRDSEIVIDLFNIRSEGNLSAERAGWSDSVHGGKNRTNILYVKSDIKNLSGDLHRKNSRLNLIRNKLFEYREQRVHPFKDDKILTDWNGLMISAFAKAAQAFENENYLIIAKKSADFILSNMLDKNGRLLHRFRDGQAGIAASIDDYAFMIAALLDIYETDFNINYLSKAIGLNNDLIKHYWNNESGGFFFSPDDGEELIIRQKEIYDGALPSGNSVAALNLLRIGRITNNPEMETKAMTIMKIFSSTINKSPSAFTQLLASLDFAFHNPKEIIIVGSKNTGITKQYLREIRSKFIPNKIMILLNPAENADKDEPQQSREILKILPHLSSYRMIDNSPTVYLCENYNCKLPVNKLKDLKNLLSGIS